MFAPVPPQLISKCPNLRLARVACYAPLRASYLATPWERGQTAPEIGKKVMVFAQNSSFGIHCGASTIGSDRPPMQPHYLKSGPRQIEGASFVDGRERLF